MAVLGGGTAGSTTALLLARAGRRVAVVERRAGPPGFKIGEGLPPTVQPLLARLGLADLVSRGPHQPAYVNRSAWGSAVARDHDFLRSPGGHGWHLDRVAFDEMLLGLAREAGAAVFQPVRLGSCERVDGIWHLQARGGAAPPELAARFLVDASGRGAALAHCLGARRRVLDRLIAIWCLFPAAAEDEGGVTLIEAFADGWWYSVRLPEGRRIAVLLTDADVGAARTARSRQGFADLLADTLHVRASVGGLPPCGAPAVTVASSSCLDPLQGEGWLAVGDAALTFDPLSSQGILTALYSAEKAAAAVEQALAGQPEALPAYGSMLRGIFADYGLSYRRIYQLETRWTDRPFWRRRALG